MLKNKFSVLKSVALVMVLLMTVAVFAACGKETNDDSAAISSALDALQSSLKEQANQNASQSSAFNNSQEEQNKLISSMLAEQAKDLEEQAKKQAEALAEQSKKLSEQLANDAKKQADALASAAASQSKALAEQSKKLSEQLANDAAKQSSILAAAAASQSKELAEQSEKQSSILADAAASQSKELEEQSQKLSSMLAEASNTTTSAPIVVEDITAQVAELSSLKLKYVVTMANYYIGDNYARITNIFDVASLQMNNAKTVAAAEDILAQVKVDAEAIPNAQNVANAFKAQVDALGDIETEVFTTSVTKVKAARKALDAFEEDYAAFTKADANWDKTLGIRTQKNELAKAENKIAALTSYIQNALTDDMNEMYVLSGKRIKTPNVFNNTWKELVSRAYYEYQVLSIVNGGDVSDADLPIAWEYKYDEEGNIVKDDNGKVYDKTKPIDFFTTEQMMDVYVLPWADEEFEDEKDYWIDQLKVLIEDTAIVNVVKSRIPADISLKVAGTTIYKADLFKDAEADIEDYFDAFEDELKALSYAADYKASGTLADAKHDLFQRTVKAYAAALADVAPAFKAAADELINTMTEEEIDKLSADDKYYARDLERLNVQLTNAQAKVDAITSYALDEISTEAVRVAYAKFIGANTAEEIKSVPSLNDVLDDERLNDKQKWLAVQVYLEKVAAMGIANAINGTSGNATIDETDYELADLLQTMIDDLTDFKDKFLEEDGANYDTYKGDEITSIITGETTYKNAAKLAALKTDVEKAIAELSAIKSSDYADKEVTMLNPTKDREYNGSKTAEKAPLYFQSAAAKQYAIDNGLTGKELYENSTYRSQLLTKTATSWPVTYTYTAAEQAMMAASDLYKAAYDNAANVLLGCTKLKYAGTVLTAKGSVVYNLKGLVAGNAALTAEVDALANYYVAKIDKAMVIDSDDYVSENPYIYDTEKKDEPDHITVADFTPSSTQVPKDIADAVAEADKWQAKCNNNEKNEYADTTITNLRTLWEHKTKVANEVATEVAKAKNTYKMVASATGTASTDIKVVSAWNTWISGDGATKAFHYDDETYNSNKELLEQKIEPSAKAATYEAAIDSLISQYTTKIMGVTMDNAEKEVKNWVGQTLFAKAKVGYSFDKAKKLVDAYQKDILGSETEQQVIVKSSGYVIHQAERVDSRIYDLWFRNFMNQYLYETKAIQPVPAP